MTTLYLITKILHILGFATAVGVTLASIVAYGQFWRLYAVNREQGVAAFRTFTALQAAGGIGLLLAILAGITMLWTSDWMFLRQPWFHIKLTLILLIFVNGFIFGRTATLRLRRFLGQSGSSEMAATEVAAVRGRLFTYQVIQLAIFTGIIILSVFRFT